MDTRSKIISAAEAAQLKYASLVHGYFDPLTADHVRRLQELAAEGPITILLDSPQAPLLPAGARAELLAALNTVKQVIIADETQINAASVIDERTSDLLRTEQLMAHVKQRQNAARD